MKMSGQDVTVKSERTLLVSLLMSAPGPILTGIAAASSYSATQLADFLRRTVELVALFVAWWVFRKRQQGSMAESASRRLEHAAHMTVTASMGCSGAAMAIVGVYRLFNYEVSGSVTLGLVIAALGLIANTAFWWRYRSLFRKRPDPVIAGQERLYRAKALVDLVVVGALTAVAVIPTHPATHYIDAVGSILVSVYLFFQVYDMVRRKNTPEPA